jgi:hypothetical protein
MSMSKQDFIKLADALRAEKPAPNWSANKHVQWEQDIKAIADACASANPRFMRERWLLYVNGKCGKNGGPVTAVCIGDGCGRKFEVRESETSAEPFASRYCRACLAKREKHGPFEPITEVR